MDRQEKILLLEEDKGFGTLLQEMLVGNGFVVELCLDEESALAACKQTLYNMYIVCNGNFIRERRIMGDNTIALLYSDKAKTEDIVNGYAVGCDEYVTKPCVSDVLVCKIKSWLNKAQVLTNQQPNVFKIGKYIFDPVAQILMLDDVVTHLSTKESDLLRVLVTNLNQVVERNNILIRVWKTDNYFSSRSLSVYVNHLRNKLMGDEAIKILNTHGRGYKLTF